MDILYAVLFWGIAGLEGGALGACMGRERYPTWAALTCAVVNGTVIICLWLLIR